MRPSILSILLLVSSTAQAGWTGVRVFVGDPKAAWDGTSDCAPCNRICADLARYVRGTDWRVGFSEQRREGGDNHFALLRALPDDVTPYFEAVRDGKSIKIVEGYRGDIQAVVDLYPGPTRRGRFEASHGKTIGTYVSMLGAHGDLSGSSAPTLPREDSVDVGLHRFALPSHRILLRRGARPLRFARARR